MGVPDRSRNDLTDAPADNRKDPTDWKSSSDDASYFTDGKLILDGETAH